MSEWGVLALVAGGGLLALSKSKNLGQIEQAAKQMSQKGASGGGFKMPDLNRLLQSHEYAGGFKGKMDKSEALKILGCKLDADEKEINQKYRSLMISNHPDKGGSPYVANKINEAKDLLSGKNKGSIFDNKN